MLQEETALQMHSFRDAEPQPVIPQDPKKNHGMPLKQLRPWIHISLTTTDRLELNRNVGVPKTWFWKHGAFGAAADRNQ